LLNNVFPKRFTIKYSELKDWKMLCTGFEERFEIPPGYVCESVRNDLEKFQYPLHIINGLETSRNSPVFGVDASHSILSSLFDAGGTAAMGGANREMVLSDHKANRLVFGGEYSSHVPSNPHIDAHLLLQEKESLHPSHSSSSRGGKGGALSQTSTIPSFLRKKQQFIIYQSKGFYTGGTVALELLHKQLLSLGYESLLCDLSNENDSRCSQPPGTQHNITQHTRCHLEIILYWFYASLLVYGIFHYMFARFR
jgi:hypothetical protein